MLRFCSADGRRLIMVNGEHRMLLYPFFALSDLFRSCALRGRILTLRQDSTHLHYRAAFPSPIQALLTPPSSACSNPDTEADDDDDTAALVKHYLNLEPNLTQLYEQWSLADLNFKKKAPRFAGVRILKQDAWEALVGFICSSNNNIARISQMVRAAIQFSHLRDSPDKTAKSCT